MKKTPEVKAILKEMDRRIKGWKGFDKNHADSLYKTVMHPQSRLDELKSLRNFITKK